MLTHCSVWKIYRFYLTTGKYKQGVSNAVWDTKKLRWQSVSQWSLLPLEQLLPKWKQVITTTIRLLSYTYQDSCHREPYYLHPDMRPGHCLLRYRREQSRSNMMFLEHPLLSSPAAEKVAEENILIPAVVRLDTHPILLDRLIEINHLCQKVWHSCLTGSVVLTKFSLMIW